MIKRINDGIGHLYLSIGVKLEMRRVMPVLNFTADLLAS